MVEIPFENTTVDTRIHFADIQTARSGKSTLINYVLKPVTEIIYEELEIDNEVLSVIDYTTPSLIGSHIENKKFDENAEQTLEKAQEVLNAKLRTIEENQQYNDEERVTRINVLMARTFHEAAVEDATYTNDPNYYDDIEFIDPSGHPIREGTLVPKSGYYGDAPTMNKGGRISINQQMNNLNFQ